MNSFITPLIYYGTLSLMMFKLCKAIANDPWMGPSIADELRAGESHKQMYERLAQMYL